MPPHPPLQLVAYNKMDVPDSSDYWEDVREQLAAEGVPADAVFAIRHAHLSWRLGRVHVGSPESAA